MANELHSKNERRTGHVYKVYEFGRYDSLYWGGVNQSTTVVYTLTLSSGEIPWFEEKGEIRRCDWLENTFFCMCPVWIIRLWVPFSQSQRRISPFSSNHGISPNDSVNYSG